MKEIRKLYWMAVIATIFLVAACTKIENTNIGAGLIPPVDGVITLDTTLDILTSNFITPPTDSLKIYKSDDHAIGVINNDPLFGKTTASAFFELKPTSYKYSFPDKASIEADSAVLVLSYKGSYGDATIPQRWEVREVVEKMQGDSVYSTTRSFATGERLNSQDVDLNILQFKDSVKNRFELASNQIRIKLDKSFAARLIKDYDSTTNNGYDSDSSFRVKFKGFAVQPAAGSQGNGLVYVNLLDSNTKLALYYNYKRADSQLRDTTVSYFRFNSTGSPTIAFSANANHITRSHAASQLTSYVNTNRNDSLVFIQTAPGTYATIKIPQLTAFPNVIIHRAELLAFQHASSAPMADLLKDVLTAPRYLLLSGYNETAKTKFNVPNDFVASSNTVSNIETFGGFLMDKAVAGASVKAYTFDVSRYVQGIVTRNDSNYTLRLYAPVNDSLKYTPPYPASATFPTYYIAPTNANNIAAGRVRLGGGGLHKDNPLRMRLRILYSRI